MVWVKVDKSEKSLFDGSSYLVFFTLFNKQCHSIVTYKVLKYLKIDKIIEDDMIFIVKSFNRFGEVTYLIKNVRKI